MNKNDGPISAFALGWAGVIPFAIFTIAIVLNWSMPIAAPTMLIAYSAAILSFMGGVQWGVTMRAQDGSDYGWRGYAVSVLPALAAWIALLTPIRVGLLVIATTFALLLGYDLWAVRRGNAPDWYARLRWQLTSVVVTLVIAATVALTVV